MPRYVRLVNSGVHGMFWWLLDFKSCFVPVEFNKKASYYMLWNMMQYTFFIILERIQSGLDKPNKGSWNSKHLLIKRNACPNQKVYMFHVFLRHIDMVTEILDSCQKIPILDSIDGLFQPTSGLIHGRPSMIFTLVLSPCTNRPSEWLPSLKGRK